MPSPPIILSPLTLIGVPREDSGLTEVPLSFAPGISVYILIGEKYCVLSIPFISTSLYPKFPLFFAQDGNLSFAIFTLSNNSLSKVLSAILALLSPLASLASIFPLEELLLFPVILDTVSLIKVFIFKPYFISNIILFSSFYFIIKVICIIKVNIIASYLF